MRLLPAVLFATILLLPLPTRAWNGAGHRLVAAIAWQEMDARTREQLTELLASHPDIDHWRLNHRDFADPARGVFEEASTWADEIRHDPRFHGPGETEDLPVLAGFPDMERHGDWHFVDRVDGREQGSIDRQIDRLRGVLRQGTPAQRSYALVWLLHLVADIHQPLHVGSRNDRGGNEVAVEVVGPPSRRTTLHAYWDDLAGPSWLRGDALLQEASRIGQIRVSTADDDAVARWRAESAGISRMAAYPPEMEGIARIDARFASAAQAIAERQIALAGRRLAHLLVTTLAPVSRETGRSEAR